MTQQETNWQQKIINGIQQIQRDLEYAKKEKGDKNIDVKEAYDEA